MSDGVTRAGIDWCDLLHDVICSVSQITLSSGALVDLCPGRTTSSSIYIYIYMTICIEGVLILSMILIPIIYGATHPMVGLRYPWKGGLISFSSFWPYVLYWSGHHRRCNQNQFCFLFWGMVRLTEHNVFLHIRSGISII